MFGLYSGILLGRRFFFIFLFKDVVKDRYVYISVVYF